MSVKAADYYTDSCLPYAEFYLKRLAAHEPGLIQLNLCSRAVDDACVAALLAAMRDNTQVATIALTDNRITDAGLPPIAAHLTSPACRVHTVDLSRNKDITDAGVRLLIDSLNENGTVTAISVEGCSVSSEIQNELQRACGSNEQPAALKRALVAVAQKSYVKSIDLSQPAEPNFVVKEGDAAAGGVGFCPKYSLVSSRLVASALAQLTSIVHLNLSNNNKGDLATKILAEAVATHPSLQELQLRNNDIADQGAEWLASSLQQNTMLFELDVSGNVIGNRGADQFMELVKVNHCLSNIVLGDNNVSPAKKSQVVHSLLLNSQPPKLKHIYATLLLNSSLITSVVLDGSAQEEEDATLHPFVRAAGDAAVASGGKRAVAQLNCISCRVLANALDSNTSVRRLILPNNRIGDDGAALLALLISRNNKLEWVDLKCNSITSVGAGHLATSLVRNTTLKTLLLDDQSPEPIPEAALQPILTQLNLNVEPSALKRLVPLLQENDPSVQLVDLTTFDRQRLPTSKTCTLIADSLRGNHHVTELILSQNAQIKDSVHQILEILHRDNPPINTLRLSQMGLTDVHVPLINSLIQNSKHLHTLDLHGNCFTKIDSWVASLLEKNHTLTQINLEGSVAQANPADLRELEVLLRINAQPRRLKQIVLRCYNNDPTLKEIELVEYHQGSFGGSYSFAKKYNDSSAKLLCDALLHNQHVKKLDVSRNHIGDDGAKAIADMLCSNRSICTIDLSYNNVTDEGFKLIGKALLVNPCVSCLITDGNPIKNPGVRKSLNLVTGHNNDFDVYSLSVVGDHTAEKELEAAIGDDALKDYEEAQSGRLRMVMAKYNRPLYKG